MRPKTPLRSPAIENTTVPDARENWIDATKGLMIILVVFGHTWRGISGSGLLPEDLFKAVDSRIYAFHMPVFFALAGWFFLASLAKRTIPQFIASRLQRLLWPMVLWTYIFLGVKLLAGQFANKPISTLELLILPVPGRAHLWFLWALLILSVFFVWAKPFLKEGKVSSTLIAVIGLSIIAIEAIHWPQASIQWIGAPVNYAVFFFLGMFLSHFKGSSGTHIAGGAMAAACFCVLLLYWPYIEDSAWAKFGRVSLTLCVLIAMSAAGSILTSVGMQFLCWLGTGSMAIYLAHTIFAAGLREMLLALGIDNVPFHIISGTLLGLLAPLLLLTVARYTRTDKLLGF